jgi:transcriptional regulator with XRE-family HTH domain
LNGNNFWGNLIRSLREEQRISQRTLAFAAKVNRSTLRRIESGQTSGDIRIIERLLNCLGYELEALEEVNAAQTRRMHEGAADTPSSRIPRA